MLQVAPADAEITCWCAMDDATVENGCMRYVPGSHRRGLIAHEFIMIRARVRNPQARRECMCT
ncbi:MAG: phytanoyl-CoA dioxygenase family protein [Tepidisphaeraceae bacterium]